MKRAFVTRSFRKKDPIEALLREEGYEVQGWSMLSFKAVPDQTLPAACDVVFAYSGNGVRFLRDDLAQQLKEKKRLVAAMGKATAEAWERRGFSCFFVGKGAPVDVASAFAKTLDKLVESPLQSIEKGKLKPKICFLEATTSQQSIQRLLEDKIEATSLKCYENSIDSRAEIPVCDLLFLTSPLNAKAALSQLPAGKKTPRLWCIGTTTANEVEALGFKVDKILTLPLSQAPPA